MIVDDVRPKDMLFGMKKLGRQIFLNLFIGGKSCLDYHEDGCKTPQKIRGNSILFEGDGRSAPKYMFVGQEIYMFDTEDKNDYNVGPSGIPYPFAYSEKKYLLHASSNKYSLYTNK